MEAYRDAAGLAADKRRPLPWEDDPTSNVVRFPVRPKPARQPACSTTGWYHAAAILDEQSPPRKT